MPSARRKRAQNKYYIQNIKELKTKAKSNYSADPTKKKAASKATSKASYSADPEKKAASKASYSADPTKKKAASKAASKASYSADPEKKKAASKASYSADPAKKKAASCAYSKKSYAKNPTPKIHSSQAYYADNKESRCAYRRAKYALVEPKREVQEQYVKEILGHLLIKSEATCYILLMMTITLLNTLVLNSTL